MGKIVHVDIEWPERWKNPINAIFRHFKIWELNRKKHKTEMFTIPTKGQ